MIIKINKSPIDVVYICLPVYLYHEPWQLSYSISFFEFLLYIFTFYVVIVNLRTFWKIQMFHRNFQILATPMFGLWIELIIGKLITMAYQLEIIRGKFERKNYLTMWTDDEEKMLIVDSTAGLELMIFGGFLEWHYMASVVFGIMGIVLERALAFFMIRDYEKNTNMCIPLTLTLLCQLQSFLFSTLMITNTIGVFTFNCLWIIMTPLGGIAFFLFRSRNRQILRVMEDPNRKTHFTVSHRFQVRENERFTVLAMRLIFSVLISIVICSTGIAALSFDLVPPFLCHFSENCIHLNPLVICFVTMYSLPAWKSEFLKAFPSFELKRRQRKNVVMVSGNPMDALKKKLDKETNIYFEQLTKSWD